MYSEALVKCIITFIVYFEFYLMLTFYVKLINSNILVKQTY